MLLLSDQAGGLCQPWDGFFNEHLDTCVRGNEVRQASGYRRVSLVDTTSTSARHAMQLVGVDGVGTCAFGRTDVGACS